MSLVKKDIVKNISSKAHIQNLTSNLFFNSFIEKIKLHSKTKIVKISNFGSFIHKVTPARKGRNPKTKENYMIKARSKLFFKPANKIRSFIN